VGLERGPFGLVSITKELRGRKFRVWIPKSADMYWAPQSRSQSQSYFTSDGHWVSQYVLVSSPTLGLVTWYCFLPECCCLKFPVLLLWGALSDKRTGLQLSVQSLKGPSHAERVTILYCLILDSPNLKGQVSVFVSPGTGWPIYTPGHWVPVTSPLTTLRATVEVFQPASTRELGASPRKSVFKLSTQNSLPLMQAYSKAASSGHYFIYYSPQTYQSHQKLHQQPLETTQQ
jgi:hypothetical protein